MRITARLRVGLSLLLLFAAGATLGAALTSRQSARSQWGRAPKAPAERLWREYRTGILREHVGVTPEQETRLAPLLDRSEAELRAIREEFVARVRRAIGANSVAVRRELAPDQQAKFDAWLEQIQSRKNTAQPRQDPKP